MKLSKRLEKFIDDTTVKNKLVLTKEENRTYQLLKTLGERVIKGREIRMCDFEYRRSKDDGVLLEMVMEGRHSMSVGRQLLKILSERSEIDFVQLNETKRGASVLINTRRS